jgi:hypothetical protein
MEVSPKEAFNRRKFISVSLFLTLAASVLAAIVIQIFEALENNFFVSFFTVLHIFTGLVFSVLSVIHIIFNWQAMKVYFKTKRSTISREFIYAFMLTMLTIFTGVLFVCFIMK